MSGAARPDKLQSGIIFDDTVHITYLLKLFILISKHNHDSKLDLSRVFKLKQKA